MCAIVRCHSTRIQEYVVTWYTKKRRKIEYDVIQDTIYLVLVYDISRYRDTDR